MKSHSIARSLFNWKPLLLSLSAAHLISCASIISGTDQTIQVEARSENKEVMDVHCELRNKEGKYKVVAPAAVVVERASDDLIIACKKEDLPEGLARADSGLNGVTFWNILLGGIIGLGVDAGTGAINDYPDLIIVQFGKNVFIEDEDEFVEINEKEIYAKDSPKKKTSQKVSSPEPEAKSTKEEK